MKNILYIKIGPIRFSFLLEITNNPLCFQIDQLKLLLVVVNGLEKIQRQAFFTLYILFYYFSFFLKISILLNDKYLKKKLMINTFSF